LCVDHAGIVSVIKYIIYGKYSQKMKRLILKAPGKINLYLNVLGKRDDGYHQIETVVQSISIYDTLYFEKIKEGIHLICNHPYLCSEKDNLVYRAARLFFKLTNIKAGVRITVDKSIPVGGGLGGGSADAAATLLGLNSLFNTNIPEDNLEKFSSILGSDVPFFIKKGTALLRGRGDEIHPLPSIKEGWIVLVYPNIPISTSWVYSKISSRLTQEGLNVKLNKDNLKRKISSGQLLEVKDLLYNKLEEVVIEEFPLIEEIKNELRKRGARGSLMSGSGSTVFALTEGKKEAEKLARYLQSKGKVYLAQPTTA